MIVYFVRHGESRFNATGRFQHGGDLLSPVGVRQAEIVGKRVADLPIEIILSSPFVRAKQTAEIIQRYVSKPIELYDSLRENKMPTEIEGRLWSDEEAIGITMQLEQRYGDESYRYSDEETFFDVRDRAVEFLAELDRRTEEELLVVTHGMILKMIVGVMIYGDGLTPRMFRPFNQFFGVTNTGLTMCKRSEYRRWEIVTWNDQAHLAKLG